MKILMLITTVTLTFSLRLPDVSGQNLQYPVDVLYYEPGQTYFVSNWNQEGAGKIFRADGAGNITGIFYTYLKYPGGMAIVGDVLYVTNNYDIINYNKPSYLVGIDLNSGQQVLNRLIDADQCYLDLMDTDGTNLYFGNSVKDVIYKYNIQENDLTELVQASQPFGLCYDYIHGRVVYFESDFVTSVIKSVKPDGTDKKTLLNNFSGYLEGIIMDHNGRFYYSSWGDDYEWGNERVYSNNSTFSNQVIVSTGHNRPFGMCIMPEKKLYVCNWGGNSFSFPDISEYLPVNESSPAPENSLLLSPNPCEGKSSAVFSGMAGVAGELTLTDLRGRVLFNTSVNILRDDFSVDLDLASLSGGMYFVTFHGVSVRLSQKLIIQ